MKNILVDLHEARRNKESTKVKFISALLAELEAIKKSKGKVTDDNVLSICVEWRKNILSNIKKLHLSLSNKYGDYVLGLKVKESYDITDQIKITSVEENIEKYEQELEWLMAYLPQQLTEEEIDGIITDLLDQDKNTLGKIMRHFSLNYKGRYDGQKLKEHISSRL